MNSRQFTEEFPAFVRAGATAGFQLFAGPEHGAFGTGIEAFGIEQRRLVVIAEQTQLALGDAIDARTV